MDIGGFTRAADYLGYAQSTVTSHVQAIEQELRKPLFYRLGKKMMLTEAGKHLLPYAAEMVELYEKARHIPENDQEPSGNLIIGVGIFNGIQAARHSSRIYKQISAGHGHFKVFHVLAAERRIETGKNRCRFSFGQRPERKRPSC